MVNQNVQEKVAKELAELLAQSNLNEAIKKRILDNLDKLPDYIIFGLVDALKSEEEEMSKMLFDLDLFFNQQEEAWKKAEAEQSAAVEAIIEEEAKKIEAIQ